MLSSKKINLEREFVAGVYLDPEPHTPPPIAHCIRVYTQGRGEGRRDEPEGRGEGQQFTKLGRKYQHD